MSFFKRKGGNSGSDAGSGAEGPGLSAGSDPVTPPAFKPSVEDALPPPAPASLAPKLPKTRPASEDSDDGDEDDDREEATQRSPSLRILIDSSAAVYAPTDYGRGFKISLALHAALFLLVTVKAIVFPGKPMVFTPTLRVDMVGLPDILKKDLKSVPRGSSADEISKALKRAEQEAKKIKEIEPPKEAPAPKHAAKDNAPAAPDEMVLKPKPGAPETAKEREKRLKGALARIKALDKITADDDNTNKGQSAPIIKGNRISGGTSLSGDAKEGDQATYAELIRERLHMNWALPVVLSRQSLSAQVRIYIDGYGHARYAFTKRSGNVKFDEEVERAIQQSQPFPRPPEELRNEVKAIGIEFGFPL